MKKVDDPRIIRTKKLLHNAFLDLIEKKGIENVNVKDLTQTAELNRGTFYLHYKDIYDFLVQNKNDFFADLQGIIDKEHEKQLNMSANPGVHSASLVSLLEYMAQNERFLNIMLGPKGDSSFIYQLKAFIEKNFYEKLKGNHSEKDIAISENYLVAYVVSATLGVVECWIENKMDVPSENLSIIINQLANFNTIKKIWGKLEIKSV